jgi:uncharacterized protein YndB with AHSA1/START domain
LKNELIVTRSFQAPRSLVFKAFTDADHLKHWWGPAGWAFHVVEFELRPGGVFRYYTESEDGVMHVKIVFDDIAGPEKLVFVNAFSDEAGRVIRAPFWSSYPLEIRNVFTFTEDNGQTMLTMRSSPVNATEEELQFFASVIPDVEEGFSGTFERLAAYLSAVEGP